MLDNMSHDLVYLSDNLSVISKIESGSVQLVYIDPPFNTGKVQKRESIRTVKSDTGTRVGFKGVSYDTIRESATSYNDSFADYWAFLAPRLEEAYRILKEDGTLYLHLDYREVHYAKVFLDGLFGRENFINEIIWAYDYGARATKKWPAKHDNILVYSKSSSYYFNNEEVDREPYMAPGLVTPEKAARGKLPTDVWWHTIVSPTGKEKTGYVTQTPEGILRRIVTASSRPGDLVLDFFAGSGTTGAVSKKLRRRFILVDENPEAFGVMRKRLDAIASDRETLFID
jgi:site-specific DNA-methyltransferase (adenine-specific)